MSTDIVTTTLDSLMMYQSHPQLGGREGLEAIFKLAVAPKLHENSNHTKFGGRTLLLVFMSEASWPTMK